jgi:hypothetical protein
MERKWRRDQIQETWTQEQWNEMYKKAESGETTNEIEDWNELYDTVKHADDPDVKSWNEAQKPNI